jgi:hypothetical protein
MAKMIDSHAKVPADCIQRLTAFLAQICSSNEEGGFVRQVALSNARWLAVEQCLSEPNRNVLRDLAFNSPDGFFSPCNLKAHYVLDEDFIDGGSALIVFALVGSTWNHVIRVRDQNIFISVDAWLAEDKL